MNFELGLPKISFYIFAHIFLLIFPPVLYLGRTLNNVQRQRVRCERRMDPTRKHGRSGEHSELGSESFYNMLGSRKRPSSAGDGPNLRCESEPGDHGGQLEFRRHQQQHGGPHTGIVEDAEVY